jgi:hypothetical protein
MAEKSIWTDVAKLALFLESPFHFAALELTRDRALMFVSSGS